MNCKTGCGTWTDDGHLCEACDSLWTRSMECERGMTTTAEGGYMRALVDFCNRVRAERNVRRPQ